MDSDTVWADYFRELEKVWAAVYTLKESQRRNTAFAQHAGVEHLWRKPLTELMARQVSLGPSLRLMIIECFLEASGHDFYLSVTDGPPEKGKRQPHTYRRCASATDPQALKEFDRALRNGLLRRINERRAAKQTAAHVLDEIVDEKLVFDKLYAGPFAVREFYEFLSSPTWMGQPFIEKRIFFKAGRAEFLERIENGFGKDMQLSPMLLNIYGTGLGAGLQAFTSWLAHDFLKLDDRPVLVIPLTRTFIAGHQPGDAEAAPRIFSHAEIVGIVHAFVTGGASAARNAPPIHDNQVMSQVIDEIRRGMARRAHILIFEGYRVYPNSTPLEKMVADDHLNAFIAAILHPPISQADDPLSLAAFARNKIVVTSNLAANFVGLPENDDIFTAPLVDQLPPPAVVADPPQGTADLVPSPDIAPTLTVFLAQQRLLHPESVRDVLMALGSAATKVDLSHVIDGVIEIASKANPKGAAHNIVGALQEAAGDAPTELASSVLRKTYEQIPKRWAQILELVSLAPDGLRPSTIKRFARRASMMPLQQRPFPLIAEMERDNSKVDLLSEIEDLCRYARAFFGRYRSDTVENFDGIEHPLEFGLTSFARRTDPAGMDSSSLDFLHPEVKLFFRSKAVERLQEINVLRFHVAARLLAEDALLQMTIGLRHMDDRSYQSIRSWRRLFSVFYHGLQSLHVTFDDAMDDTGGESRTLARLTDADFGVRDLVTISRQLDFWKYLNAFCFRTLLEQAPRWNLSRAYGLDELKLDLLKTFDRPWRLWHYLSEPLRYRETSSLFEDNRDELGIADLAEDFGLSYSQAQIATGQYSLRFPMSKGDTAKRLKRAMDVDLLTRLARRASPRSQDYDPPGKVIARDWLEQQIGPVIEQVDRHVDDALLATLNLLKGDPFGDNAALPSTTEIVGRIFDFGMSNGWTSGRYSDLSDILARLAEVFAIEGEFNVGRQRRPGVVPPPTDGSVTGLDPNFDFCRSLVLFDLAESIRLRTFSHFPLDDHFHASGHAMRQSIRVALKLEGEARALYEAKNRSEPNSLGVFAAVARRRSDTLARHLHFPRERAGQLVLEATMLRKLSRRDDRDRNYRIAMQFIAAAEALTLQLGETARIRLHLALERAKLSRSLAELRIEQARHAEEGAPRKHLLKEARLYMQHCALDISTLSRIAAKLRPQSIWTVFADIQKARAGEAAQRIKEESKSLQPAAKLGSDPR